MKPSTKIILTLITGAAFIFWASTWGAKPMNQMKVSDILILVIIHALINRSDKK